VSPDVTRTRLTQQADFALGGWTVRPAIREVARGADRIVIEPRVMQVLIALHRADGGVVARDALTEACWEGRVVGEDAINRVLSRLRRLAGETGAFRIETVTRVGYRLIPGGSGGEPVTAVTDGPDGVGRRRLLRWGAAAGLGTALAAGGVWWFAPGPPPPHGLSALLDKADGALSYGTPEQNDAAVGIMRQAATLFPQRAEVWGRLAVAYRQQGLNSRRQDAAVALDRAQAAARRALEIDRGNADAGVVATIGNGLWHASYAEYDRRTREALARFPDHALARRSRSAFLFETGHVRESLEVAAPLVDAMLPAPTMTSQAVKLWSAGRPDEAEGLLDTLIERWPRHYSVWATRYQFLMFSGSFEKAMRMLDAVPVGLEPFDIDMLTVQTNALRTGDARAIDAVLARFDGAAAAATSKAQEAAMFASAAGRGDAAFAYLDLLFVSAPSLRAFRRRFAAGALPAHGGTLTFFLFEPPMRAVRADPRFVGVATRLGLEEHWRRTGAPDFRRHPSAADRL
jgi:tetratricopeptide (TPR) repeat protein